MAPSVVTPEVPRAKKQGKPGKASIDSEEESGSTQTSKPSERQPNDSNKRWSKPGNARALASQANEVATMLLNEEIPIEQARTFAALARVISQLTTAEVMRSRYLKQQPNLKL